MTSRAGVFIVVSLSLVAPRAWADGAAPASEKATCLDAASKGQRARDTHHLVDAREHLRRCAAATCPGVVQTDCASWLAEVEHALPTIVLGARSGTGLDLFDVKVTIDGQPLTTKLDGRAIPIDPGPHAFHFEGADGATADRQVLVREGEKGQGVSVALGTGAPASASAPPSAPQPAPAASTTPSEKTASPAPSSPWKTVGWVLGGVGVAGLATGAVLGFIAMNGKSTHCGADNQCEPGTASGIKSTALGSDIGWIAGGVLAAAGGALILWAPSGTAHVKVAPAVTGQGGGVLVAGRF